MIKVFIILSAVSLAFSIRCYSGMQGSVNGDSIGQIEIIDCNGTDWCVKLPSTGHVGRKHYAGAQYSCDFGECRKDVCEKRDNGEQICCCKEDECNGTVNNFFSFWVVTAFSVLMALLHSTNY